MPKPASNIKYRLCSGWCTLSAKMASHEPEKDYAVVITKISDGFELRIRELLISVHAATLDEGWHLIQQRVQEVIDFARTSGVIDELPSPLPPPPI